MPHVTSLGEIAPFGRLFVKSMYRSIDSPKKLYILASFFVTKCPNYDIS
jgi:hypothetical protein